jgi:C-terminal processing protease CtpA/Prc
MTADAGEILAVAFKGRNLVRTFGKPTSGIPTLNKDFPLTDGARLMLTTAVCTDRTGNIYVDSLEPDTVMATDWSKYGADNDPVIEAALNWLKAE